MASRQDGSALRVICISPVSWQLKKDRTPKREGEREHDEKLEHGVLSRRTCVLLLSLLFLEIQCLM